MASAREAPGRAVVGISGFDYPRWRGVFYPEGLPGRDRLAYASRVFGSIELNGTFYGLESPEVWRRWAAETPDGFVFAIKGSRDITHTLRLEDPEKAAADVPFRHAFEPRHESFFRPAFYTPLRAHGAALVVSDSARKFPTAEVVTGDFVYVRLHGSRVLYTSGYTDEELDGWAAKARGWTRAGCDVFVYFDNDAKVEAPKDARRLSERLGVPVGPGIPIPEGRRGGRRRRG